MKRKEKILHAATKLFAEHGYEKTSMQNICRAADVSRGLIYHHFESKAAILVEIFSQTTERMVEMNKRPAEKKDPNLKLKALIELIFTQLRNDKLFFQFNLNIMFQPSTRELLKEQIQKRGRILFESVRAIFEEITPSQSKVLSYIFIAEIDGVALNYLSIYEDYPLDEVKQHLLEKYDSM